MKPSHELFHLIHSLTKSEKRFFKLTSSLQSGEKNYYRLFDYIAQQTEYDEYKLKEHFKDERFIKHLPSEKNHLYKLVLKSLRQFHGEQSVSGNLTQALKNIEILYGKALHKEAGKFLKRAKKIAHKNEEFYFLNELISWEKILTEEMYQSGDFDVGLNLIIKEESEVIDKLMNLAEYHVLYSRINAVFRSDGFTKNKEQREVVKEIENHPLIKGKNTAISVRATSICYYIQGLCAVTNRNFDLSYEKFNKVRKVLDKNPKIKIDLGQRYILTLFHLMKSYINSGKFDMAQEMLNQIKELKGKKGFNSLYLKLRINNILLTDQMHLYNLTGNFEKADKILNQTNHENSFISKSNKEHQVKFYYTAAYTLFGIRNFKDSLYFINLILNDNERNLRQDIYSFARILNLMLHFELGNFSYIEYSADAYIRFFNKIKRDNKIEKVLIKRIKSIARLGTKLEMIPLFNKAFKEIELLLENKNEQVISDYIDVNAWLKSKITGESFTDLVSTSKT